MSPTYTLAIVAVIVQVLNLLKIEVTQESVQNAVVTVYTILAGLVIAYRRWKHGGITALGTEKK